MSQCECGCGEESARDFLPGHDQKLRTALETRVGGLLSLRSLVLAAERYANGESTEESLLREIRGVFARVAPPQVHG
jgi:hypothetical protein